MSKFILGGGVTGLAAGIASGWPVFEAEPSAGGICASYYMRPSSNELLRQAPADQEAYRFEVGGGHWIFGAKDEALRYMEQHSPLRRYDRRSSVFFSKDQRYVPYPLQNHLYGLPQAVAQRALQEMETAAATPKVIPTTMEEWLKGQFGSTLHNLFFDPFHDRYVAGLHRKIAPQDAYKSALDMNTVREGAVAAPAATGYNTTFVYPENGLDALVRSMANKCDMRYGHRITDIDVQNRSIGFSNGTRQPYEKLISTLPLNSIMSMAELDVGVPEDPYTSVLVLNIGARKGAKCPNDHWLYIADADAPFHRVGFYSNVDPDFLPKSSRTNEDRVSIYVERTFIGGTQPSKEEADNFAKETIHELQKWEFIREVEAQDLSWISIGYTWSWPHSQWKDLSIALLQKHNIFSIGRYGRWHFQGIADSILEGRDAGKTLST